MRSTRIPKERGPMELVGKERGQVPFLNHDDRSGDDG
jgi:hypothetical protein